MGRPLGPVARLGWLLDGEFDVAPIGPNRQAADAVAVSVGEHFADAGVALLVGFVMLAEGVDADPTNAALWGQYRAAEILIREAVTSGTDDEFSRSIAELSAALRDPEVAQP